MTLFGRVPQRVVESRAPTRVCDNGGWTDTWFARHGRVCNIAVTPAAHVRVEVFPNDGRRERVRLLVKNYGDCYLRWPEDPGWGSHPLLEAVIRRVGVAPDAALTVAVWSDAPPGASTGTSAAVAVALAGALARAGGLSLAPAEAARLAHDVETTTLGWQSGVQDQAAAAHGGLNYIEVDYPDTVVRPLTAPPAFREALERRLALIYLGRSHRSSHIHDQVVGRLEGHAGDNAELDELRALAGAARDAVLAGDLGALGRASADNTEVQARLHPDLVSGEAREVIAAAAAHGAAGWKVNGAGGAGGSIAILGSDDPTEREAMLVAIARRLPASRHIPTRLSFEGLQVVENRP